MTDTHSRASAEMAFRSPVMAITPETKLTAWEEYKARQAAVLDNMARLRELRLWKTTARQPGA
jgi:hypothetical protein